MDASDYNISEQVSWTLSLALINHLASLLQQATNYYLAGDIEKAFFRLKAVRMRIIQNLKDTDKHPERKKCIDKEIEFAKKKINKKLLTDNPGDYLKAKQDQMRTYEEYNTLIMDLLEKYGYLIKKREDRTSIVV